MAPARTARPECNRLPVNRHDYYITFYETPAQKLMRAAATAVLAWMLQWLLIAAALTLRSVARAEAAGPDQLAALVALAVACALLAWRLRRRNTLPQRRTALRDRR